MVGSLVGWLVARCGPAVASYCSYLLSSLSSLTTCVSFMKKSHSYDSLGNLSSTKGHFISFPANTHTHTTICIVYAVYSKCYKQTRTIGANVMENPLECAKVASNTQKGTQLGGVYEFATFYLQQITPSSLPFYSSLPPGTLYQQWASTHDGKRDKSDD